MRCLFAGILSIIFSECFSQKLLFHKNRYKEVFYQVGETISFNLKGNDSKISAQIKGFEGNLIVFQDFKVNPGDVTSIYVDAKTRTWFILRYKYKAILPIIGFGYMLLELLNTGSLSNEAVLTGSIFIAAGLLAKVLISETIKIKGRRKLVVID